MNTRRITQRSSDSQHPSNQGPHTPQGPNTRVQAKRQLGRCCPSQAARHTLGVGNVELGQHRRLEMSPRGKGPSLPLSEINGLEGQYGIPDCDHGTNRAQVREVPA